MEQPPEQPLDPSLMRASDADRDRVADALRDAVAEGRLTPDEHAERIDLVYRARTYADLTPILADLPANGPTAATAAAPAGAAGQPVPSQQSSTVIAILSGAERKGRWLVEPHTNIYTLLGGVELDLRNAVLSQREVTFNIVAILGGVSIKVPPGVRVINNVVPILGGVEQNGDEDWLGDPDAPVVKLTGMALLAGVEIQYKELRKNDIGLDLPGSDLRELMQHRRELRQAEHEARRNERRARHQARREQGR